ncbi:MAG: hypothetical protein K9N29_04265 [Candidatus Marinimicrobia bacterium]|nr:hypothetical protein [Candidatus Neomarinimicrobiota bacterium]
MSNLKTITKFSASLIFLILCIAPALSQDASQQDQGNGNDSLMIFGDGQNGSALTDYDYEALIKELYGSDAKPDTATKEASAPTKKQSSRGPVKGPAPGLFKNSRLNGSYFSLNMSSPFAVSGPLESWFSYIDAGAAIKFPYEIYVESIPLFFLLEVSSFSFENTFPQGGTFAGIAYIIQASAIGDQSSAAVGFGVWDSNMGSMLELGYRFRPTQNTFIRVGTRGVLITDIDLIGSAWWAELRLSMGFEL